MMECVADNEHPPPGPDDRTPPSGVPAQPGGELSVRPGAEPAPATPPAPPIDPEAVRQFQQFQQFQELMRQQKDAGFPQGTPPPAGFLQPWGQPPPKPPPKPPLWKRALKTAAGKLVTLAIVALLVAAGGYWLLSMLPGSGPPTSPGKPHDVGGKKAETNLIYETDPRNAVQKIYDDVAQDDPTSACGRFTEDARAEFADHFAELGPSCEDIVKALGTQVSPGEKSEYANPRFPPSVNTNPTTDSVPVSSCAMEVTGGPRLGLLTVSRIQGSVSGQWIVTRHDAEPADCSGVSGAPTS
jgi:hypothetical protein